MIREEVVGMSSCSMLGRINHYSSFCVCVCISLIHLSSPMYVFYILLVIKSLGFKFVFNNSQIFLVSIREGLGNPVVSVEKSYITKQGTL